MHNTPKPKTFVDQLLASIDENIFDIEISLFNDDEPYEPKNLAPELRELLESEKLKVATHLAQNEYGQAAIAQESAYAITDQNLGPIHQETIENLSKLADCYFLDGKYEEAKACYLKAFRIAFVILGKNDPLTQSNSEGYTKSKAQQNGQHISLLSSHIANMVTREVDKTKSNKTPRTTMAAQLESLRATRDKLDEKMLHEIKVLLSEKKIEEAESYLRSFAEDLVHSSNKKSKELLPEVFDLWIGVLSKLGLNDSAEKTRLLAQKILS
jgi:tetratricopeptide (TPR) repeat protein